MPLIIVCCFVCAFSFCLAVHFGFCRHSRCRQTLEWRERSSFPSGATSGVTRGATPCQQEVGNLAAGLSQLHGHVR
jgi:hypothetical protein